LEVQQKSSKFKFLKFNWNFQNYINF
jgi:hypothetical protein